MKLRETNATNPSNSANVSRVQNRTAAPATGGNASQPGGGIQGDDTHGHVDDLARLAFPDEAGRFEFAALRPGRYRIAAQLAAGAAKARWVSDIAHMIEIDVPGGTPTEVELPVSTTPVLPAL